jgi:integrase
MTKNATGEGTIYKRKDGRYEAAVWVTTTAGTRRRLRTYATTRQAAHEQLVAAKQREQQGIPTPERDWRLGSYLDYWLEELVRRHRRPATYYLYEMTIRRYLKPRIGSVQLTKLSVPMLQTVINQLSEDGRSNRQVQVIRTVLSAALTRAVREELVTRNVARLVEVPSWQPAEVVPWTATQARQFLEAAQSSSYYPAFVLLLLYGLRRGEVLGLRWQDVDREEGVLHVRQQLQRLTDGLHIGPVKTRAGERDLPLLGLAERVLDSYQADRTAQPSDLLFVSSGGKPIEPTNLVRSFQEISKQTGLPRIKLHHLRHTTATLLKDAGVPARDAQLILGHSQISVTQQIYQHDTLDSRRKSLGEIEKVFLRTADGSSSRQMQPSRTKLVELVTSFVSGGPGGTRTLDILLKSPPETILAERLTAVRQAARMREKASMTGAIAVILAVRSETSVEQPKPDSLCPHCEHHPEEQTL